MQESSLPCQDAPPPDVGAAPRRATRSVDVKWGERVVTIGGSAPVVVQSMTNTDTADAIATAIQVKELALAGSEMVRITVNTPEAAREVAAIREQLDRMGVDVPLVGDFHYNGQAADAVPGMRAGPVQVPDQSGQHGWRQAPRRQFRADDRGCLPLRQAGAHRRELGSLDHELMARKMDENNQRAVPWEAQAVMRDALVVSAISNAQRAEELACAAMPSSCLARSAMCRT